MADLVYNGTQFEQRDSDGMVNLTAMCKANGKEISNWTKLEQSQAYIAELASSLLISGNEIFVSKPGSPVNGGGTWAHPLIALAVAQWISPAFHVWCNRHIKTLIETGSTTTRRKARLEDYDNDETRVEIAEGNKTLAELCDEQDVPFYQPHVDRARGLGYINGYSTKPLQEEAGKRDWISAADKTSKAIMLLCNLATLETGDPSRMLENAMIQREAFTRMTGKTPREQLHFPKGMPALSTSKRRVSKKTLKAKADNNMQQGSIPGI